MFEYYFPLLFFLSISLMDFCQYLYIKLYIELYIELYISFNFERKFF